MALISSANDFIGVFIIAVLCVCAWMFIQQKMENLTYVKSNIDDNETEAPSWLIASKSGTVSPFFI